MQNLSQRYNLFLKNIYLFGGVFDVESTIHRLQEIEHQLSAPGAWDSPELLTPILQEKSRLETETERSSALESLMADVADWLALAEEEETEESTESLLTALMSLEELIERIEMEMLLSGEEDHCAAIMDIHPGAGGTEAQDWAAMILRMYLRWAESQKFTVEYLDFQNGDEAGIKSVTIRIDGINAYGLLREEAGIHRLIRISPFDSSGRRHTSFASVDVLPDAGQNIQIDINESDLRIDVYRASGAGGQHVNRTNSAVRITHLPTNTVVQCQNEKSQHSNRESAMKVLRARLYELELKKIASEKQAQYQDKEAINFGSQIRTYTMQPYRLVKDHRTNTESSDVNTILDGTIDKFIHDLLLYRHANQNAS